MSSFTKPMSAIRDSSADASPRSSSTSDESPASDDPLPRRSSSSDGVELDASDAIVLSIHDATRRLRPKQIEWLWAHVERAADELRAIGELRIRLVADGEMADAHQRHMDAACTTDVITFDLAPDDPDRLDTDLLICVDEASRQSESRDIALERELLLYAIHGLLHCNSYDDAEPDDARAMHQREDEILVAIGVGATFSPPRAQGARAS